LTARSCTTASNIISAESEFGGTGHATWIPDSIRRWQQQSITGCSWPRHGACRITSVLNANYTWRSASHRPGNLLNPGRITYTRAMATRSRRQRRDADYGPAPGRRKMPTSRCRADRRASRTISPVWSERAGRCRRRSSRDPEGRSRLYRRQSGRRRAPAEILQSASKQAWLNVYAHGERAPGCYMGGLQHSMANPGPSVGGRSTGT